MKKLVKRFIILVWMVIFRLREVESLCVSCHLPPNASEDDIKQLFIMDFKKRLMEKLHLKTEPKSTGDLPTSIIQAIAGPNLAAGDEGQGGRR